MIKKYYAIAVLNVSFFILHASEQQLTKADCTATLRKIVACRVGASNLDECRGCMTEKELLGKAVTTRLLSNNNSLFKSEEELREAALQEAIEKKDDAAVIFALKNPYDAQTFKKCNLRATERLVQAKESELAKDPENAKGVCTPAQVMEECAEYFKGKWFDFYNSYNQLVKATELAILQNKGELAIALKEDANSALQHARLKRAGGWAALFVLLGILSKQGT